MKAVIKYLSFVKKRNLPAVIIPVAAASAFMVGFIFSDTDYFFKINKSIDIFGRVYKEITMNYVDEIDPERFMEAGVDGLLGALDPYTNYISEKEIDDVELITFGKYGGIGVTIGFRDGNITVTSLMEGYSAQQQGLQPGDRILEVDGESTGGMKPENIKSLTRGEPGTEVRLKIKRDDEPDPLEFTLVREEIQLKNITYSDFAGNGVAYIRLERFSRGAGDELGLALKDLKLKGVIKGVVLDVRNNPGGLLDAAVNVVEKFVSKGSLVVSTRGRGSDSEKKFFVDEVPMAPDVPVVVLINRQSASASEIVAGAIQDLDRGVILGTRSFGKGLVQTIVPLIYNTQLKITTAKYYTPSGRCIQEIDYLSKNRDGVFATTPDSLKKKFRTVNGRTELEAGGIEPDTVIAEAEHSALYNELVRKSLFYRFAKQYASAHNEDGNPAEAESLLAGFGEFLKKHKFTYQDAVEAKLKELNDLPEIFRYSPAVRVAVEDLIKIVNSEKENSLIRYRDEILSALRSEIAYHYRGEKGKIEEALKTDVQVQAAVALLLDDAEYKRRLSVF